MKQLKTLIKLHKNMLDEKRRFLQTIINEEAEINNMISFLDQQLEKERELMVQNVQMGINFGAYQQSVYRRQDVLRERLKDVHRRMELAQEEVRKAFRELKKYEITLERRQQEEKAELARRERIEADDNTAARWIRKKKTETT